MKNIDKHFTLSSEFAVRILGAFILSFLFILLGEPLTEVFDQSPTIVLIVVGLLGFLTGLILTPYLTTRPLSAVRRSLLEMAPERLTAVIFGLLLGLLSGGLFSIPLSFLPSPFREILPLASVIVFSYLSTVLLMLRQNDLKALFSSFQRLTGTGGSAASDGGNSGQEVTDRDQVLLDTSVIIDGRITDISKTGFIRATLLIPNFILRELQHIADSPEAVRRNRGRRGLEVLSILQNDAPVPVRITDIDAPEVRDADSKLIAVAKQLHAPIMTNDYNLNRVAELQGVNVMNINDLANAIKVAYLPGEELTVKVIQEGREVGQGVGYLDDGTMVVVEDGVYHMSQVVGVLVTKVLQTSAGRMVFARFLSETELSARSRPPYSS